MGRSRTQFVPLLLLLSMVPLQSVAAEALIAVAANFWSPAKQIAARFEQATGHTIRLSQGSSGKLYAQIRNGAPYDVFLSADQTFPARLLEQGQAVSGSRLTYARGVLALWSADEGLELSALALSTQEFQRIALANPKLAPYGLAAQQVLDALGLSEVLQTRLVFGENISQAYQFVATGNAEVGFVALSQTMQRAGAKRGSLWLVPTHLHDSIAQDAVLLSHGASNEAAQDFLKFLQGAEALELISSFGYRVEEEVTGGHHNG